MQPLQLLRRQFLAVAVMGALIGQVAEEGHRTAEFLAAVGLRDHVAVVVLFDFIAAVLYDVGVFCKMLVDMLEEAAVDLEFRQHVAAVDVVGLYLVEHLQRVRQGLGVVGEELRHLLLALEKLLLGVAQALGVVEGGVGRKADESVVGGAVLFVHEVHVVGGHHLDAVLPGEFEDAGAVFLLSLVDLERKTGDLRLVEHYLEVVVVAEHPLVPLYSLVQGRVVAREDVPGYLSGHAGRAADEPFVVLLDDLVAHPWLVVHALDVAGGHYLHQVPVAGRVLGQQNQVIVLLVRVVLGLVVVVAGDVDFAAQNRLDRRVLPGHVEKVLDAVHVAVVGDCEARHAQLLGPPEELLDIAHSVQDGVLRVDMKMYEGHKDKDTKNHPTF